MSRMDEIRERLSKATPGDWTSLAGLEGPYDEIVLAVEGNAIKPVAAPPKLPEGDNWVADADFIANAPADIRYLLDENTFLRSKLPF